MKNNKKFIFKKFFAFLLVCFVSLTCVFSISGCDNEKTIVFTTLRKRSSTSIVDGQQVCETYADQFFLITNNICSQIVDKFGISQDASSYSDYTNLFSIKYSNPNLNEFAQHFSVMVSYSYYNEQDVPVLLIARQGKSASFVRSIIEYKDLTTIGMQGYGFVCINNDSKIKITQISNVSTSNKAVNLNNVLELNNVYRIADSTGDKTYYYYLFLGNNIGSYSLSSTSSVCDYINAIYSGSYAKIEHNVNLTSVSQSESATLLTSNYWKFSLKAYGEDFEKYYNNSKSYKSKYTEMFSQDIGVEIYRVRLAGNDANNLIRYRPNELMGFAQTGKQTVFTLLDFYNEAKKYVGQDRTGKPMSISKNGEIFTQGKFGEKKVFIMACCEISPLIGYSKGSVDTIFEQLFSLIVVGVDLTSSDISYIKEIISNNASLSDAVKDEELGDETQNSLNGATNANKVQQTDNSLYLTKSYRLNENYSEIENDINPICSLIFKNWSGEDEINLSSFQMFFDCSDFETLVNNYTFIIRYRKNGWFDSTWFASTTSYIVEPNKDDLRDGFLSFEIKDLKQLVGANKEPEQIKDESFVLKNDKENDVDLPFTEKNMFVDFSQDYAGYDFGDGCFYDDYENYFQIIFVSKVYVAIEIKAVYL